MSDDQYDPLVWGSHLPALLACVGATVCNVLEIGVGHFSTPALHALCGASHRRLVSIERNADWFLSFSRYASSGHQILFTEPIPDGAWSVAFIDDSPGGENRANHFKALIMRSIYVVVHDYHKENEEHIAPLLASVPYVHVTRTYQPPTLVASMRREIPKALLCL